MKKITFIAILHLGINMISGQYGDKGLEISVYLWQAHFPEYTALGTIMEDQRFVEAASSKIAKKNAGIYVLKQAYLKSLKDVSPALEDSQLITEIYGIAEEVVEAQAEAYTYIIRNPLASPTIAETENILFTESFSLLTDLVVFTTDGEGHLMNTVDRLHFLEETRSRMVELRRMARRLLNTVRSVSLTESALSWTDRKMRNDSEDILKRAEEDYNLIFKN